MYNVTPLPSKLLEYRRKKTGCLSVITESNHVYYIWLNDGEFLGCHHKDFKIGEYLLDKQILSDSKLLAFSDLLENNKFNAAKVIDKLFLDKDERLRIKQLIFEYQQSQLIKLIFAKIIRYEFIDHETQTINRKGLSGLKVGLPSLYIYLIKNSNPDKILQLYSKDLPRSGLSVASTRSEFLFELFNEAEIKYWELSDALNSNTDIAKRILPQLKQYYSGINPKKAGKLIFLCLYGLGFVISRPSPSTQARVLEEFTGLRKTESLEFSLKSKRKSGLIGICFLLFSLLFIDNRGVFTFFEYSVFDRFVNARGTRPNNRVTLVKIEESDIESIGSWRNFDDDKLAQTLENLLAAGPAVVGIDLYRNLPVNPGHNRLNQVFQDSRIIGIQKALQPTTVDPPPALVGTGRIGFSDLVLDPADSVVRRGLLSLWLPRRINSLGTQVALEYLKSEHQIEEVDSGKIITLGEQTLYPISANSGFYRGIDNGGYQIMIDWNSSFASLNSINLADVYKGTFDKSLVQGKMIFLGATSDSLPDYFSTPFSKRRGSLAPTYGVVIHANIATGLVDSALGEVPLLSPLPYFVVLVSFGAFSLIGISSAVVVLLYQNLEDQPIPGWVIVAGGFGGLLLFSTWLVWFFFTKGIILNATSILFALLSYIYGVSSLSDYSKELFYSDPDLGIGNRKYLQRLLEDRMGSNVSYTLIICKFDSNQIAKSSNILPVIVKAITNQIVTTHTITKYDEATLIVVMDYVEQAQLIKISKDLDSILRNTPFRFLDNQLNCSFTYLDRTHNLRYDDIELKIISA